MRSLQNDAACYRRTRGRARVSRVALLRTSADTQLTRAASCRAEKSRLQKCKARGGVLGSSVGWRGWRQARVALALAAGRRGTFRSDPRARGGVSRGASKAPGKGRLQGHFNFSRFFPRSPAGSPSPESASSVAAEGGRARRGARARATFRGDRRRAREGVGLAAAAGPGSGSLNEASLLSRRGSSNTP